MASLRLRLEADCGVEGGDAADDEEEEEEEEDGDGGLADDVDVEPARALVWDGTCGCDIGVDEMLDAFTLRRTTSVATERKITRQKSTSTKEIKRNRRTEIERASARAHKTGNRKCIACQMHPNRRSPLRIGLIPAEGGGGEGVGGMRMVHMLIV